MSNDTSQTAPKVRPVYRNINVTDLMNYRLPIPGIVSIMHRISGVALFIAIPFLLALLQMSLKSEAGFETFKSMVWGNVIAKLLLLGLLYAFVHHFCAGIRFLLLDMHKGIELEAARRSSQIVIVVSLILTALLGAKLW
jgi:succinate dehydrogenase / fumarate reductase, cytochrome b subunit